VLEVQFNEYTFVLLTITNKSRRNSCFYRLIWVLTCIRKSPYIFLLSWFLNLPLMSSIDFWISLNMFNKFLKFFLNILLYFFSAIELFPLLLLTFNDLSFCLQFLSFNPFLKFELLLVQINFIKQWVLTKLACNKHWLLLFIKNSLHLNLVTYTK
jgi:hypothetical protein